MPSSIRDGLEVVEKTEQYGRLVEAIANWYASLELSEDLLDRIQVYGLGMGMDAEATADNMKKKWTVKGQKLPVDVDSAKTGFQKAAQYTVE